jgi:predicted amidohydrolase
MLTTRVAAIQLNVEHDDATVLARCGSLIAEASGKGARLVVLPERFCQWAPDSTPESLTQSIPGHLAEWLAGQAQEYDIYLVGGSILERDPSAPRAYNTSVMFAPDGSVIGRYRKIHLFDAVIDGVTHGESDTITAGDDPILVETPLGAVGLTVCYDVRFPELYRILAARGMEIATIPAGFTRVTGRAHWEILVRARAIENQCYVIAAGMCGRSSPARDFFGHSMIVDPWGTVLGELADTESVVIADLSSDALHEIRERLPALKNRRLGVRAMPVPTLAPTP